MNIKVSGLVDRPHQVIAIGLMDKDQAHEPKLLTSEQPERIGLLSVVPFADVLMLVNG
jgi:hypothetical protein